MGNKQSTISQNSSCCSEQSQEYKRGLYSISPINKTLNRNILGMAYTPGVGAVCKQIQKRPQQVDALTLRGRSVAIITQGNVFHNNKIQPGRMPCILDWCIAQIKFYADMDSFPFIIRKQANIDNVIQDLSNTYAAILVLDPGLKFDQKRIPKDVAILRQQIIAKITQKEITDCESTGKILAYVLCKNIKGVVSHDIYQQGLKYKIDTMKKDSSYFILYRDGRSTGEKAIQMHKKFQGKIHIELNFQNIAQMKKKFTQQFLIKFAQTRTKLGYQNISAIVTDATAILGFGDIGPKAGLPVMEGKSLLFKVLGGVNVVPICINKRKTHEQTIEAILDVGSYFKAINLQDIKAPDCFFIERGLKQKKILPVFHDDQHGTSIVTLAALINALKVVNKKIQDTKIVISGVGAAGITVCKLFIQHGAKTIIMVDTKGSIYEGRTQNMNQQKEQLAKITNPQKIKGKIDEVIKGTDIFIGLSGPNTLKKQHVKTMNDKPIIFALANPDPEITLEDALQGGAYIYGSGRSDFKNQINNSLVFPGIFRGIHEHDLLEITDEMKEFIAVLIAQNIDRKPTQKHIIVDSLDMDMPILIANGLKKFSPNGNQKKQQKETAKL